METIDLNSWDEFEFALARLDAERKKQIALHEHPSHHLFRGQEDFDWDLKTTLERYTPKDISLFEYFRTISKIRHEIESFTGLKWNIMNLTEFKKWVDESSLFYSNFPSYEYMVYLRHHGFPSPLLDWTGSPYIAAFFAFNKLSSAEKISIYVYQERTTGIKTSSSDEPCISKLGPYVTSHKRHFAQKSEYTICTIYQNSEPFYIAHERAFASNKKLYQDKLIKYNIPAAERIKVLKQLDKYNLNRFSLFGTEESLISSIATREFYLNT